MGNPEINRHKTIEQGPIDDALAGLLAPLAGYRGVLLAVSGGSDSLALMVLVRRWANGLKGTLPVIEVATVDHGLRPSSKGEVLHVAALAQQLGFHHTTMVWEGPAPQTGLQAAARAARYRLLKEAVSLRGLPDRCAIVTAHTADDQAETFLMRLARGSGPDGLAAMQTVCTLPQASAPSDGAAVDLLRPLLSAGREELRSVLEADDVRWFGDPSNDAEVFERVRVRKAMPGLGELGVTRDALVRAAERQSRARESLQFFTERALADLVDHHGGAFARLSRRGFLALPAEIQVRVLARLIEIYGGASHAPRLMQVEDLHQYLSTGNDVTATLGGCIVAARQDCIDVFRELGRDGLETVSLLPGQSLLWDKRFVVSFEAAPTPNDARSPVAGCEGIEVTALGMAGLEDWKASWGGQAAPAGRGDTCDAGALPWRAQITLPAFRQHGRLIWVGGASRYGFGRPGSDPLAVELVRPVDDAPLAGAFPTSFSGHGVCKAHFVAAGKPL